MILVRIKCPQCPIKPGDTMRPQESAVETLLVVESSEDFTEEELAALQGSIAVNFCSHVAEVLKEKWPRS